MTTQKQEKNPAIVAVIITGTFGIVTAIIGGCFLITNTFIENRLRSEASTPTLASSSYSPMVATDAPVPLPSVEQTPVATVPPVQNSGQPTIEKDNVFVTAVKTYAVFVLLLLAIIVTFFTVFIDIFLLLFGLKFSLTTALWAFAWQTITVDWYWNRAEVIGIILGAALIILSFLMSSLQSR